MTGADQPFARIEAEVASLRGRVSHLEAQVLTLATALTAQAATLAALLESLGGAPDAPLPGEIPRRGPGRPPKVN